MVSDYTFLYHYIFH